MELQRYKDLLVKLWPLHRTLVSDDTDKAYELIHSFLKDSLKLPTRDIQVHEFESGSELSTWFVPKKYTLNDYGLTQLGATERCLIDRSNISLSIAEYSQPVDAVVEWEELKDHLFYSDRRPDAIPFVFKYFYRSNYGFCLPKTVFDSIDRNQKFHLRIDSEFNEGMLKLMEVVLPGKSDDSLLVMSNICHPHQVNDSITGVINNLMLIEHFMKTETHHTLRFGFWPETIGAMAYFTRYRDQVSQFKYAVFTEMLGTSGKHAFQLSRQENTLIDRVAEYALSTRGCDYLSGRYTTVLRNDERISNGVNLDIPSISLSRYPYPEYHTSDDNPSIIDMKQVEESWEITRDILTIVDEDRTLVPGELYGQPFLTRYDLFYDPILAGGDASRNYNKIMEDIFSYSDGTCTLFDIAQRFNYPWEDVRFLAKGLEDHNLFSVRSK
jgi:aminopeptidase-like protein